jgi:hypothetical protein
LIYRKPVVDFRNRGEPAPQSGSPGVASMNLFGAGSGREHFSGHRSARRDRCAIDCFHMRGQWDADGTALMAAVRRVAGQPALRIKSVPWMVMRLLAPFWGLMRELVEMRYLWDEPFKLDNAKLVSFLGAEVRTPLDEALAATLAGMGCLPAPAPAPAPGPAYSA